jgi:ppGpp synthetase/RelA/SpoT-type nucleotidyltranferase
MSSAKPTDIRQYEKWLKDTLHIEMGPRVRNRYFAVANQVKADLEQSTLWSNLLNKLKATDEQYLINTTYRLLVLQEPSGLNILVKPYESVMLKSFRKNVLENPLWPNPPTDGWLTPDNWLSRIKDIVRTLIVVKYLDGVKTVSDSIREYCTENSAACDVSLEAREEGYYAAHLNIWQHFLVPGKSWDLEDLQMSVEVQVTTQVQEVIRRLTHRYYEDLRKRPREPTSKWQWDYKSEEFLANYLGHILHYVEGMIMDIRDRQREGTP